MKPLSVLQVFRNPADHEKTQSALLLFGLPLSTVVRTSSVQDAIERLENQETIDLVIFEQRTASLSVTQILLGLKPGISFIFVSIEESYFLPLIHSTLPIAYADQNFLETSIPEALKTIQGKGFLKPEPTYRPEDYIQVNYELITSINVKQFPIFTKEKDQIVPFSGKVTTLGTGSAQNKTFYLLKTDYDAFLKVYAAQLQQKLKEEPLQKEEGEKIVQKSHDLIRDLLKEGGFNEEAQKIARASVEMTLKLIGSKPRLSEIMQDLREKQGPYITSHSVMLGKVACAMAHKVGWNSATTYFKLSLAAFMHDITLDDTRLAKISPTELNDPESGLSAAEIRKVKLHPVDAADYTRRFSEIPSDVDQIVLQHHERPDGSGFPRGLTTKYISPLSSLFILAHELVDYSIVHPGVPLDTFFALKNNGELQGAFKKIVQSLVSDIPIS